MDRPGDQLLARARLAEDQHGGVAAGDQFHPLHDRAEPRLHAHDRVAERLASEPGQQRAFVGLGGLAQGGHFAQPKVVVQRHRERLQEQLGQFERVRRRSRSPSAPARPARRSGPPDRPTVRPTRRPRVGRCERRQTPAKADSLAVAMRHFSPATPFQQRLAVRPASNRSGRRGRRRPRLGEARRPRFPSPSEPGRSGGPAPARPGCAAPAWRRCWRSIGRSRCAGRPPARRSGVPVGTAPWWEATPRAGVLSRHITRQFYHIPRHMSSVFNGMRQRIIRHHAHFPSNTAQSSPFRDAARELRSIAISCPMHKPCHRRF